MQQIQVSELYTAFVDDVDFERILVLGPWSILRGEGHRTFYAQRKTKVGTLLMHHLVKPQVKGKEINHINGNGLDNRRQNLEYATHQVNILKHYDRFHKPSALGRGVYICGSGRYVATLSIKGKRTHLGTFDTLEEARNKYEQVRAQQLQTNENFNSTNFL